MPRATVERLFEIQRLMIEEFAAQIETQEKCPHCKRRGISAAMLNVVRMFLAENGATWDGTRRAARTSLDELKALAIPFTSTTVAPKEH